MKTSILSAATVLSVALFSASINAATISGPVASSGSETWTVSATFGNGKATSTTISCPTGACQYVVLDDLGDSSVESEIALLNGAINPDVDSAGYDQFEWADTFTVTGQYFMMKFGDLADVWFKNLLFPSSSEVTVDTGSAMGLSHVTTTVSEVPVPGTLGLLGLALAGLGAVRRRKA